MKIPREQVKALFDLAISSMDFGSGFWDQEDVDAARAVAISLGLDPLVATPGSQMWCYNHEFVALYAP